MVVTDLGIMKFDDETKRMYCAYMFPGVTPEIIQENTGFEIDCSRAETFERLPPRSSVSSARRSTPARPSSRSPRKSKSVIIK